MYYSNNNIYVQEFLTIDNCSAGSNCIPGMLEGRNILEEENSSTSGLLYTITVLHVGFSRELEHPANFWGQNRNINTVQQAVGSARTRTHVIHTLI